MQRMSADRMAYRRESVSSHAQKKVDRNGTLTVTVRSVRSSSDSPIQFIKPDLFIGLTRRRELDAPGPGF